MIRVGLAVLAVACASCTCGGLPPPTCQSAPLPLDRALIAGEPSVVTLGIRAECFGSVNDPSVTPRQATEVLVEVFDPDNHAVPFEAKGPTRSGAGSNVDTTVDVAFTADRPGPWTVRARFEPGVGTSQQTYSVAVRRGDAGVRTVAVALPNDCIQYGLLEGGTVVCVRGTAGTSYELAIGAGRWPGAAFIVDRAAVFRVSGGDLSRLEEDAGTFTPVYRFTGDGGSPVVAAHDGELWLVERFLTATIVTHGVPSDGGYLFAATLMEPLDIDSAFAAADRVVLSSNVLFNASREALSISSDGGRSAAVTQRGVAWSDDEAGWLFGAGVFQNMVSADERVTAIDVAAGRVRFATAKLPTFAHRNPGPLTPAAPVVPVAPDTGKGQTQAVLRVDDTGISYEVYDPGPGFAPVGSATRRHAFARAIDGTSLKIFDR